MLKTWTEVVDVDTVEGLRADRERASLYVAGEWTFGEGGGDPGFIGVEY